MTTVPFLRIPPFPGHRAGPLAVPRPNGVTAPSDLSVADTLVSALRQSKVGGTFWAAWLASAADRDVILAASSTEDLSACIACARAAGLLGRAVSVGPVSSEALPSLPSSLDPWHICAGVSRVIASANDEITLIAAILGLPLTVVGTGRFAALAQPEALGAVVAEELCQRWTYRDPFADREIDAIEAVAILGRWRALIDANRAVASVLGIARWKRITADNLLWSGSSPVPHDRKNVPASGAQALAWITRSDPAAIAALEAKGVPVGEIEDGMIRSTGLGANCVPPLSIVVDTQGPHFDPAQASALESLLETAEIDARLLARAADLRRRLVQAGISKYENDGNRIVEREDARSDGRRLVLVTGQVEDDRAVLTGGGGLGNLELLRRARAQEPESRIIFKPHPDVEAGHRKGHVPDAQALEFADEIDRTSSIAALLDRVDALHVISSLAGFEGLMRGREVVTHGVPFYAGWGLTRDLGPVPGRRTRRRTLDELVAATLILYPRYLDPVTRLPCEAEVLVERIAAGQAIVRSPQIWLREWQGRLNRLLGRR
ncbi:beta-3-deoxy-D-manno-oct-2-ulosonic acid transferase [Novosphingobium sp. BL-8H]|uniref:capsular polysaccharide export protein, LipB/KpsS family n=1 Tax=Novosphingobium sp. BL-8H TaxID=3127640 RepID=UPI003758305D